MTFACSSAPGEMESLSKNRPKKCRTRTSNRAGAFTLVSSSPQADGVNDIFRNCFHVFVLDELRENFLERGQMHQLAKPADAVLGFDLALVNDDHLLANPFDHFEHMRDVKDDLSTRREFGDEPSEQQRRRNVETRQRLIENQNLGIMQERRGDENPLLHSLRIRSQRRMPVRMQ